jgi:hypothetical protein
MLQQMKILHLFIKAEPKSSIKAAFEANPLLRCTASFPLH